MVQNFSIKIYKDKTNEMLKDIHITKLKDKNPFNVPEGNNYSKKFPKNSNLTK